jgi:hypothetical protein
MQFILQIQMFCPIMENRKQMKFIENIANYVLENVSTRYFPEMAMKALEENIESESIIILAGMTENDNTFELEQYFNSALKELQIELPEKLLSAKILIRYYLNYMIGNRKEAFETMQRIDNDIYKQINWEAELNFGKKEYLGIELGLEFLYTWYRELQDYEDGSMLLYYNELSKEKQREKFEEHLLEEAIILKDKLDLELTALSIGLPNWA